MSFEQSLGIRTYHAWTFTHLLTGSFTRNKEDFKDLSFPILGPLPHLAAKTHPLEGKEIVGPFIYFISDGKGRLCYVGKSQAKKLFSRWVRPGNGGPATHYWSHTTKDGGSVFRIADGLLKGEGPFILRFAPLADLLPVLGTRLGETLPLPQAEQLSRMESFITRETMPLWNKR